MPSMADSRQEVKQQLASETDHDAILASLQDEIDRHNSSTTPPRDPHSRGKRHHHRTEDTSPKDRDRKRKHLRFRFKSGAEPPKRKRHHHRSRRPSPSPPPETAHPFPREPVSPEHPDQPSNTHAFQASLFDALADDEAAAYWESVYSQPIHIYPRPSPSHNGRSNGEGGVDGMTDDEYAAFVQQRMWERAHPEIVVERELKARKAKEEAEAKEARKRAFVRAREREAWERAGRAKGTREGEDGEYEYVFDSHTRPETPPPGQRKRAEEDELYTRAWQSYWRAWQDLTTSLTSSSVPPATPDLAPSKRIPWPTLPSNPPTRPHIEAFMRRIPVPTSSPDRAKDRERLLKAERVRWHPDKVQQRFRGAVDEGTMKVVTGVFQVVDGILGEERGKA